MLKILKHRASGGVLSECFIQWQGYRASEATWEPVAQANNLNTELVQEYAARKGLALPEGLDLEISDYSDSDVFTDGDDDDEGAVPGTVTQQEASDASDEALVASQILEDMHAVGADVEGEGEDEDADENEAAEQEDEDDGEGVHLNDEELDDVNDLIMQVVGQGLPVAGRPLWHGARSQ